MLDVTVVRLGWNFHFDNSHEFGGGVLWAIGWSRVVMSGLVFLPTSSVAVLGIALVAFHNLLDGMTATNVGLPNWLWVVLHQPGGFEMFPDIDFGTGGTHAAFSDFGD